MDKGASEHSMWAQRKQNVGMSVENARSLPSYSTAGLAACKIREGT